jgi:signal transduction histidine kinase
VLAGFGALPDHGRLPLQHWTRVGAAGAGALAVLFGFNVLLEWALRDRTSAILSLQAVQPLTAVSLALTGAGVLCLLADRSRQWASIMRRVAAAGLLGIGLAVSAEYLFVADLGIDHLLFSDTVKMQIGAIYPGRPSIVANVEMLLIGLVLALDDAPKRWDRAYAATATLAALIALVALVGYGYQAEELYEHSFYTSIGVRAAAVALLQCAALLTIRPDRSWVGQLWSSGIGGTLARRLFPPVILTPLLLGWVLLHAVQMLGIDPHLPLALFAVILIPVLCALILWVARTLDEIDRRRRSTEVALVEAKAEAERANIAKSQFLASASHDLRQPAQSLVVFMALLAERVPEQPGRTLIAAAQQSLDGLKLLLDGLLDVSRLDAGLVMPQPGPVPLRPLLARLQTEYGPRATEKGLRLRVVSCSLLVRSDPVLLERMLRNLIDNALRFTQTGGVLVGCRRQRGIARIEVLDTGIGIAQADQKTIFEELRQLNNPERNAAKGLGLGLSIVERTAQLLGHEVTIESRIGKGSRFAVCVATSPSVSKQPILMDSFDKA